MVVELNFNVLSTTTGLSFGHGNSMQLGSNGVAYISGWDDAKVYALNLSEKTVTELFTIPASVTYGNMTYSSVAVDDENKIAYIFLRYSPPNFPTINNFVVYDYANDRVVSNKKFNYSFNGIQSIDFYCGKIFVAYGAGSMQYAPERGLFICDTNNTMLSRFVIAEIGSKEPEGAFIDRTTGDLLFTIQDDLYKILC